MCESNPSEDLMSFEVLPVNGHDSLPSDYSLLPEVGAGGLLNTDFDFSSPDLSLVEVQQKIVELANDNAVMKDALEKNNSMMKEQLNTISAWHSQITTSMSHQQLSLKEYQERCEQLLKENQELKEKVKETQVKILTGDMATETPSFSNQESPEENSVAKALIDANGMIAELKLKLDEQETMMLAQYQSAQDKIEKTEKEVTNLQQENSDLQFIIREREDEVQSLKEQLKSMEIRMLKEQNFAEAEKTKHAETKKLLDNLQVTHDNMLKQQQEQQTSDWEKHSIDQQRLLVQADSLTAQLLEMQDKLAEKEEKVEILTHQLEAVNKDSESIPVLKSQLEVFKMDLEQARDTKKHFEEEVQRLNKVVEDMQARLNPSAPPVEELSFSSRKKNSKPRPESPFAWIPKPLHGFPNLGNQFPFYGSSKHFECPVCNHVFSDAQAVQNHANRCLDAHP